MSIKPHDKSVFKLFENFKVFVAIAQLALVFFIFHTLIMAWMVYQIVIEKKIIFNFLELIFIRKSSATSSSLLVNDFEKLLYI